MGDISEVMEIAPVEAKWESFGWNIININGYDIRQIIESLYTAKDSKGRPTIIIADTVKGKGLFFMEGSYAWYGNVPTDDEVKEAITELREGYRFKW